MNSDLDRKLCEAFPLLYADRYSNPTTSCMCFGFECGDGWFNLIWYLSSKIEPILVANITQELEYPLRAAQVKQKFGGLRFYMTYSTPEITALIDKAASYSYEICEQCGDKGILRQGSYWETLCNDCNGKKTKCLTNG